MLADILQWPEQLAWQKIILPKVSTVLLRETVRQNCVHCDDFIVEAGKKKKKKGNSLTFPT